MGAQTGTYKCMLNGHVAIQESESVRGVLDVDFVQHEGTPSNLRKRML